MLGGTAFRIEALRGMQVVGTVSPESCGAMVTHVYSNGRFHNKTLNPKP